MRSVEPLIASVLEDREYRHGGQPAWAAEHALDFAHRNGVEHLVEETLTTLAIAMTPPSYQWLTKRLGVLWTMFMVARDVDERALTVWMSEAANLLCDLPHDIVAFAIDEAIRTSPHGFIPSVGEIRKHADPLASLRRTQLSRLEQMKAALADPIATATRAQRRREREAHERDQARFAK